MARVVKLDPIKPDPAVIDKAAGVLAHGGIVAIPTETLYGLAVDSANPEALARLAALKQRPADKPFPLIIAGPEQLAALAAEVPPAAAELMARHWPGPLSLVLPARADLPPELVHAGGVAVRQSPHPVAASLARALGRAISATSANPAGEPPTPFAEAIAPAIAQAAELILDSGPCPGGPPSTLADARTTPPTVLRQGAVHLGRAF